MRNPKAFTLIEMLIVIVIIGILSSALIPRVMSSQERARDTQRKADVRVISVGIIQYRDSYTQYPNEYLTTNCSSSTYSDFSVTPLSSYLTGFITMVPKDPTIMGLNGIQREADPTSTCVKATDKSYLYTTMKKGGVAKASFIVMSAVESLANANFLVDYPQVMMAVAEQPTAIQKQIASNYSARPLNTPILKTISTLLPKVSAIGGGGCSQNCGSISCIPSAVCVNAGTSTCACPAGMYAYDPVNSPMEYLINDPWCNYPLYSPCDVIPNIPTNTFIGTGQDANNVVQPYICTTNPVRAGGTYAVNRATCVVNTANSTDYGRVIKYVSKYIYYY